MSASVMAVVATILVLAIVLVATRDAVARRGGSSRWRRARRRSRLTPLKPKLRPDLDPVPGMYASPVFTAVLNQRRRRRNAEDLAAWNEAQLHRRRGGERQG